MDVAWIGLIAAREPALASILESAGLAQGNGMQAYWTMMAVRLLEMKRLLHGGRLPDVHQRRDIPKRTDVGALPPYKSHRHTF